MMRSVKNTASSSACVTSRSVLPAAQVACRTTVITRRRVSGSSPRNGSSSRTVSAGAANARHSATRCAMPPDSSSGYRPAASRRSTEVSHVSDSGKVFAVSDRTRFTFSAAFRHGSRRGSWNCMEIRPPPETRPAVGVSSCAASLRTEVFPLPEAPIRATQPPAGTRKDSPCRTLLPPKFRLTLSKMRSSGRAVRLSACRMASPPFGRLGRGADAAARQVPSAGASDAQAAG